jgi:glycosyltransferase involved in cell wall biosynthesis
MRFSVITPTFNRRAIVQRSVDSSLAFARAVGGSEVVLIDDASQDGTGEMIRSLYAEELSGGTLKLVERPQNGGSTVAKADGARSASGDWLIFLDSDDELLPEASVCIPGFIDGHREAPVFLFRCVDQEDHPIGPPMSARALPFVDLLNGGTPGECLPVISRTAFLEFPTDNDVLAFEFMATLRIVRAHGPAMLSDAFARRYHMEGADRLTSRAGNLRRAKQHARGFRRMLTEFGPMMPLRKRMGLRLRIFCYSLAAACVPISQGPR